MRFFENKRTGFSLGLLAMTALAASGCGSNESCTGDCDSGLDAPVRLIWFGTDASGDPAQAEGEHPVYQAASTDGVHFENAKEIFTAEYLVDPDFFAIPSAAGGGYGMLWSNHHDGNLYYAESNTVDGTYTSVGGAITSGGQSATLQINDVLTTFITGVQAFTLSPSDGAAPTAGAKSTVIQASTLGLTTGIVGDPTVIELADGSYRAFVKYAELGSQPSAHQMWTLTSADAVTWSNPEKLRDAASVPGAVRVNDTFLVYFVDFSGDYSSQNSLAVGYSTDNGETWEYSAVYLDETKITGAYDPAALAIE